jgi:hypothetical protein
MSAPTPTPAQLAQWVGNFESGGELDEQDGPPANWAIFEVRLGRGLAKMASDENPALDEFDGDGRPREGFWIEFARALRAVDAADAHRIDTKARTPVDWGELACTPAWGLRRKLSLLRLTGKLRHEGVPQPLTLGLMLAWNRSNCLPRPLAPIEVEAIVRSIYDRYGEVVKP